MWDVAFVLWTLTGNTVHGDRCKHYRMTGQESSGDFYGPDISLGVLMWTGALGLPATMDVLRAVLFLSSAATGIWSLGEGVFRWDFDFLSAGAFRSLVFFYLSLPGGLESHSHCMTRLWTGVTREHFRALTEAWRGEAGVLVQAETTG